MLQIFVLTLIILVVLTVDYLLCRRFPKLGDAQAFVCVLIARVLVKLESYCKIAATYFEGLFERSLNFPLGSPAVECFAGIVVLTRLVYLVVSLLIFGGELDNTLLAQGALWQTSTSVQLGGVEIASSALFLCTCAIFGSVLLECVG